MKALITIGASTGDVDALNALVQQLPADLPAVVMIVLHVGPHASILPEILGYKSKLPVAHAVHGAALEPGRIYVAPPDQHLLVEGIALH